MGLCNFLNVAWGSRDVSRCHRPFLSEYQQASPCSVSDSACPFPAAYTQELLVDDSCVREGASCTRGLAARAGGGGEPRAGTEPHAGTAPCAPGTAFLCRCASGARTAWAREGAAPTQTVPPLGLYPGRRGVRKNLPLYVKQGWMQAHGQPLSRAPLKASFTRLGGRPPQPPAVPMNQRPSEPRAAAGRMLRRRLQSRPKPRQAQLVSRRDICISAPTLLNANIS